MNDLERRRAETTLERRRWYGPVDMRNVKRREREFSSPLHDAYVWGQSNGYKNNPIPNPYPPGRRHDQFERGMHEGYEPDKAYRL